MKTETIKTAKVNEYHIYSAADLTLGTPTSNGKEIRTTR